MPTRREKLIKAFHEFDADGSGTLNKEELRAILSRPGTGSTMSVMDIDQMMDIFDDDGDGVLSISECVANSNSGDEPCAPLLRPS